MKLMKKEKRGWKAGYGKTIVAIVGRPNVGKSTIFNKLTGQRLAIVEDTPALPATVFSGLRMERSQVPCWWIPAVSSLASTMASLAHMREQAQLAIDSADCIVMVTELSAGVTPQENWDVASMLMRSGKPVVLAVNKCDGRRTAYGAAYDFYSLGLGELIPFPACMATAPATYWTPSAPPRL